MNSSAGMFYSTSAKNIQIRMVLFVTIWQKLHTDENSIHQGRHSKPDLSVTRATVHWRNGSVHAQPTTMTV